MLGARSDLVRSPGARRRAAPPEPAATAAPSIAGSSGRSEARGGTKIVAANRFFWPDQSATSQLLDDLARHLAGHGLDVHVVASRGWEGALLPRRAERDGVVCHRVRTSRLGHLSLAGRALDYLTFYAGASWRLFLLVRSGDCLLVKTDPPLMSVPAALVARMRGAELVLWHQDLFPETAEALNVLRPGGRVGRTARWLRNRSLRLAERHVAISQAMADRLAGEGVPRARIAVIPNWTDDRIVPVPAKENPLRREWDLLDRIVIGYSGNLGRAHQAEQVAELVRLTHGIPGLAWLFVGGGVGMRLIEALQRELGPERIRIRPHQPREGLSLSLSLPDLHLVSLEPRCEGLIMPSKLYGIIAVGRPVLNLGAVDGSVAREIAAHRIGWTLGPEPSEWRAAVEGLVGDGAALAEAGRRARAAYERHYRAEHALAAWQRLLEAPRGPERS